MNPVKISPSYLFLTILTILTACSPVYQTTYSFDPPKKAEGQTCIFQCDNVRLHCQHIQDLERDRCEDRAEIDYDRCERRNDWKDEEDQEYCYQSYCSDPDYTECDEQYRSCYQSCGGKVTGTTVCTAFCDQEKK